MKPAMWRQIAHPKGERKRLSDGSRVLSDFARQPGERYRALGALARRGHADSRRVPSRLDLGAGTVRAGESLCEFRHL